MRRKKHRRNSTRSLRNVPGPLTRQLSASSQGTAPGAATPAQTTPRVHRRRTSVHSNSEGSGSDMDTASLASDDSGGHCSLVTFKLSSLPDNIFKQRIAAVGNIDLPQSAAISVLRSGYMDQDTICMGVSQYRFAAVCGHCVSMLCATDACDSMCM